MITPFHFAFNVLDLEKSRKFYSEVLGCKEGRSTNTWIDFDFFGHQLSLHVGEPLKTTNTGRVDNHIVPMPHFGVVLLYEDWQALSERLKKANINFIIEPTIRYAEKTGKQWIMFFKDPSGNSIEIKGFKNLKGVFAQ